MNEDNNVENLSDENLSTENEILKKDNIENNRLSILKKRKIISVVLVAVIALIAVVSLYYLVSNNSETAEVLPCTDENISSTLKDTSKALDPTVPENINALPEIADKIVTYENYENDMYCLNILTTRYAVSGSYDEAKKYLDALEAKLDQNNIEELPQKDYFWRMEDLRGSVEWIKIQTELIEKNSSFIKERQLPDGTILPEDPIQ